MAKSFKSLFEKALGECIETESGESISRRDAIVLAIIDKAMRGDLPAVNFIKDLTQKKSAAKTKASEEVVRVKVITEQKE